MNIRTGAICPTGEDGGKRKAFLCDAKFDRTGRGVGVTGLPDEGSRVVRAQADWTTAAPLALSRSFVDDPRGYRTLLSKIEPGPFGDVHAHNELEQIYVIEGDF